MGTAERREREKEQRRNDIIDAAEKVFFSKGLEVATMDEVAETAELSKGTLYLYFKNKEDLYLAITQRGLKILADMFNDAMGKAQRGMDKIKAIGRAYVAFSKKYPQHYYAMIYYESHDYDYEAQDTCAFECHRQGEQTLNVVAQALQTGIEDGSINSKINPVETAIVLWGQTTGMIQLAMRKGMHFKMDHEIDLENIIELSFQMTECALKP